MAATLLDRLLNRDPAPADAAAESAGTPGGPHPAEATLRAALAQKVLHGWAQNRQQVLVPLALNLGRLEPGPRGLIVQAMAAALAASGAVTEADRRRLAAALVRLGDASAAGAATAALDRPPHLLELVAELERARLGAQAYAAAALVLDRRVAVQRAFLDWLGARFALPPPLLAGIARRYGR